MNRQELHECVYKQVMDTINASERYVVIRDAIDAYVASEKERVTLVTPEMLDKIEVYWLHNMDYAGELTKLLRERAKG